jgi:hypothetical protein
VLDNSVFNAQGFSVSEEISPWLGKSRLAAMRADPHFLLSDLGANGESSVVAYFHARAIVSVVSEGDK